MRKSFCVSLLLPLFFFVLCGGAEGAASKSDDSANKKVMVKAAEASLRSEASSKAKRLDVLTRFTPVEVLDKSGSYVQVKTTGGKTGYVAASTLADSRFVSTTIKKGRVNLRASSSTKSPVAIELLDKYPLMVLDRKGLRVKVVDYEGDSGWAHHSYLSPKRYVLAKPPSSASGYINLREGPGKTADGKYHRLRFQAEDGTVLQVLEEKDGWLKVQHEDGDVGWCSANIVWGWHDEGEPKKPSKG